MVIAGGVRAWYSLEHDFENSLFDWERHNSINTTNKGKKNKESLCVYTDLM